MKFFSPPLPIDETDVVGAIRAAEQRTSGEIRVVVARRRSKDPLADAQKHFDRLGMTRTAARNGVLIFIAPKSRNFAVIGDSGVHEKCGDAFWRELAEAMSAQFRRGEFTGGLVHGIERAGELLAQHFPHRPDDQNELPDTIEHVD
jgi:uncharacterized membrane protein